jgi:Molybdopterin biosynthesis enzymes
MTTATRKVARQHPDEIVIGLVSISDRASTGVYEDKGIPALQEWLGAALTSPFQAGHAPDSGRRARSFPPR